MNRVLCGDALEMLKTLPDEMVQCCITSPPYWGLRDYGVPGQIGLEKTPEEYVQKMVEVFREVKRVLRSDGVLWLNLGDSYCGSTSETPSKREDSPIAKGTVASQEMRAGRGDRTRSMLNNGLKPKDLVGIPWMVAFALRADGWWLRSDVIWSKPNPMPESVTDRPTKSHEYIFLLTKSSKYYYDAEAIRIAFSESYANDSRHGAEFLEHLPQKDYSGQGKQVQTPTQLHDNMFTKPKTNGANRKTVWTIPTQPRKEAHFATFPDEIPEICIKAGTSQKGQCSKCGSPWERVTEHIAGIHNHQASEYQRTKSSGVQTGGLNSTTLCGLAGTNKTLGWQPICSCNTEIVAQIVLDPFAGSGTTLQVAKRLGRRYIGIELSEKYVKELIEPSLAQIDPLFEKV